MNSDRVLYGFRVGLMWFLTGEVWFLIGEVWFLVGEVWFPTGEVWFLSGEVWFRGRAYVGLEWRNMGKGCFYRGNGWVKWRYIIEIYKDRLILKGFTKYLALRNTNCTNVRMKVGV